MKTSLKVKNLRVARATGEVIRGVSFEIPSGKVVALMGPNGSGKSTLANALMGHPDYRITEGSVTLDGEDVTSLPADIRAKRGLFLSMQHPPEIPGLTLAEFLRAAYNETHDEQIGPRDFRKILKEKAGILKMDKALLSRGLNEGFSGGERKKSEILQLMVLAPKYAILDESDSGLDVDAVKAVADGINAARGKEMGILVITHLPKLLSRLKPDIVHVLLDGRIVKSGGPELADEIEKSGYDGIKE
ncbi:MAG: Fe-S cluster assembly ATPase SufC [Patescibacteria group bacterium]|nr:Fe-S cluster assembly ATPase SufC [Patescibacteria group bacterium]